MGFSTSLAQSDTLRINNQVISTFANGDCGKLEFPNELGMVDVDKQGNGLLAINQKGLIADLDVRLVMAADDDQYLNSLLNQQNSGSPTILSAVLTKNFADQQGNVTSVQLQLGGGGTPVVATFVLLISHFPATPTKVAFVTDRGVVGTSGAPTNIVSQVTAWPVASCVMPTNRMSPSTSATDIRVGAVIV